MAPAVLAAEAAEESEYTVPELLQSEIESLRSLPVQRWKESLLEKGTVLWETAIEIDHLGGVIGLLILCACLFTCWQQWTERHNTHKFVRLNDSTSSNDLVKVSRRHLHGSRYNIEKPHYSPDLQPQQLQSQPPPETLPSQSSPPQQPTLIRQPSDAKLPPVAGACGSSVQQNGVSNTTNPGLAGQDEETKEASPVPFVPSLDMHAGESDSDDSSSSFYSEETSSFDEVDLPYFQRKRPTAKKAIRTLDRTDTRPGHAEKVWSPVKPKTFLRKANDGRSTISKSAAAAAAAAVAAAAEAPDNEEDADESVADGSVADGSQSGVGESPDGKRAGVSPEGKRAGASPEGKRAGASPSAQRAGASPSGLRAGTSPNGTRAGASPNGTRAGASPDGLRASPNATRAAAEALAATSTPPRAEAAGTDASATAAKSPAKTAAAAQKSPAQVGEEPSSAASSSPGKKAPNRPPAKPKGARNSKEKISV